MDPVQSTPTSFCELLAGYSRRQVAAVTGKWVSTVRDWAARGRRPRLRVLRRLTELFKKNIFTIDLDDVIAAAWGERPGDSCPCGCGGIKRIPDNDDAKHLHIEIRCRGEGCDKRTLYLPGRKHRQFCKRCSYNKRRQNSILFPDRSIVEVARQLNAQHRHVRTYEDGRVIPTWKTIQKLGELKGDLDEVIRFFERLHPDRTLPIHKKFFCVSHEDHGAKAPHAPLCPRTRDMVRSEIDYQQKISAGRTEEEANRGPWQKPFIDEKTGRYRSIHCATASFSIHRKEQKLKEIIGDFSVNSRKEWEELWNEHRGYIRWNIKPGKKGERPQYPPPDKRKKRRRVVLKVRRRQVRYRKTAISRLKQTWLKPHYQFNLCNCCQHLIGDLSAPPNLCRECYDKHCDHVPLGPANVSPHDLRNYVQWTVLHYLDPEQFSFRKIAEKVCTYCGLLIAPPELIKDHIEKHHGKTVIEKSGRSPTTIVEKVQSVMDRLKDPNKLFKAFRNTARLILEAQQNQSIEQSLVKERKRSHRTPLRDTVSALK